MGWDALWSPRRRMAESMNSDWTKNPQIREPLICLVLAIITIVGYCKVGTLEFVYFDDPGYYIENFHVHKG